MKPKNTIDKYIASIQEKNSIIIVATLNFYNGIGGLQTYSIK